MKNVLLVGSSFSAVPIFCYLKSLGCKVTVCGSYEDDPCHEYADASIYVDYSNRNELLKAFDDGGYDYLVPSCNDYSYLSGAYVAELRGLPGFDSLNVTHILHTKNAFRQFCMEHDVKAPKAVSGDSIAEIIPSLKFPLIVKPTDSFSGKGVSVVESQVSLEAAVLTARKFSRNQQVIVEEFKSGALLSHSCLLKNGSVLFDVFVDEYCTVYPFQVNSSCISSLSGQLKDAIRVEIQCLAEKLNLCDGLLHTQLLVTEDDYWVVECMRRAPGDLYPDLVKYSSGVDYFNFYVDPFLEIKYPEAIGCLYDRYFTRHTISSTDKLIFKAYVNNIPAISNVELCLKSSGETLKEAPYDKVGIVFSEFNTEAEMRRNVEGLASLVRIESYKGI